MSRDHGSRPAADADRGDAPAAPERLDPGVWKIAAVALFGGLLAQLDATIVNVSLTSLASDLAVNLSTIQWVTSGYLLALTLVLPLSGWIVDRIGAKALYLGGFAAFTLTSALCGLAWSAPSLITFRILQGMSGGLLAPMAQMMIARAAGRHMARVAGFMALPVLAAPVLGPVIAGLILDHASWRWLFLVNVPVGLLALVMAIVFLPADAAETTRRKLDWLGLALLSPGLALFLYGADRLGAAVGPACLGVGVLAIAAFVVVARRKGAAALIDLRLFHNPVFSVSATTQFLANGSLFAGQMLIPAYLVEACGRSPGEMGWMLAPLGLGMMVTYPLMGTLTDRFGIRRVSAGGALVAALASAALPYLALHGLNLFVLMPALFVRGMGMSAIGLPSMTAAYASVPRDTLPMATTSLNIVQRLGGPTLTTLCATVLGWMAALSGSDATPAIPFAWAFLLLVALQALSLLSALRLPLRLKDRPEKRQAPA